MTPHDGTPSPRADYERAWHQMTLRERAAEIDRIAEKGRIR